MNDKEKDRAFRAERRRQQRRPAAIQSETYASILAQLREAETRITAALISAGDFAGLRLGLLQQEVRQAMGAWETGAGLAMSRGLDRSWTAGADLVTEPLRAAGVDIGGRLVALDPRLLDALKLFQVDRIRDIGSTATAKVTTEIAQAALGVQTPFEAARKIAPILDGESSRARMIVRTELGTAYSAAGQQRLEQAIKAGVAGLAKQWRRSGKLNPRVTHDLADGQIVDADKPFLVGGIEIPFPRSPDIPLGERINCGCTSLPYMRHWRVRDPGPRPYTPGELATSPAARQVEEVRAATPVLDRVVSRERLGDLRQSLAATDWGRAAAAGERPYGLSDEGALALHAYTFVRGEAGARDVNNGLRTGTLAEPLRALVDEQVRAARLLPIVTGPVERRLRTVPPALLQTPLGENWTEPGWTSSSSAPSALEDYFQRMPHRVVIQSKTGRQLSALSNFPQAEVIFEPGTAYRVTRTVETEPGVWLINLEEV